MSFGFGVGDFLAVATLAWKLSTTLRSAKGASASYHNLIQELESTAQTLYHAGTQLETAGLPASPANCVGHGISRCHANLRSLEIIVKKYAKSMQTPKGKERDWWSMKTGLKKISWEMCEKEGVDEIRTNIRSGVAEIMLILEACGLNALGRMESKIRETCAVVKRVEAAIPQALESWHWDHKVIYLDDALGRSIPIPFELCSQWEIFNETLKLAFRGRPGSSWIEANLFKITTQDHGQVLSTKWESAVKPSTTLLMSMVVHKHYRWRENLSISCPVCSEPQPNLVTDNSASKHKFAQIQCTKCFIWYSVSDLQLDEEADNNANNADLPQMHPHRINPRSEDITSFKRLALVPKQSRLSRLSRIFSRETEEMILQFQRAREQAIAEKRQLSHGLT